MVLFWSHIHDSQNTPRMSDKPLPTRTHRQENAWNYLVHHATHLRHTLDSVEGLQALVGRLSRIYGENQRQTEHIHSKCMSLVQEQQSLEGEADRLREIVQYFRDYDHLAANGDREN